MQRRRSIANGNYTNSRRRLHSVDETELGHSHVVVLQRTTKICTKIQSGKTYCANFCASQALLAGSGNNASFNGSVMVERMADWYLGTRGRRSVNYLYLG